jgi:hypothetical protein
MPNRHEDAHLNMSRHSRLAYSAPRYARPPTRTHARSLSLVPTFLYHSHTLSRTPPPSAARQHQPQLETNASTNTDTHSHAHTRSYLTHTPSPTLACGAPRTIPIRICLPTAPSLLCKLYPARRILMGTVRLFFIQSFYYVLYSPPQSSPIFTVQAHMPTRHSHTRTSLSYSPPSLEKLTGKHDPADKSKHESAIILR